MDEVSLKRLKLMHPKLRKEALEIYNHINKFILGNGVRLRVTQTLRTIEEQDALYAQGRTKKGPRVTNAKGGSSFHNYSLALDIVLLLDKNLDGNFEEVSWDTIKDHDGDKKGDWLEVANYFKSKGWKWGGDFRTMTDKPHFEKSFGYTTSQLYTRMRIGLYTTEVIDGKTYKWVNI